MALIAEELDEAIAADMSEEARMELIAAIFSRFHEYQEATDQKFEGLIWKRQEALDRAEAFGKMKALFTQKEKRELSKAFWIENYMRENLRFLKNKEIETSSFRARLKTIKDNKLQIVDVQLLPSPKKHPEFYKFHEPELKIGELKRAMKEDGFECEGAKLVDSESLSIK